MKNAIAKMTKELRSFGKIAHTFDDALKIADKAGIKVTICNYSDDVKGYYCIEKLPVRTKRHIVINAKLSLYERTLTLLHELAHYFLHVPSSPKHYYFRHAKYNQSKQDKEAEAIALILMIPKKLLFEMYDTPFEDINPFMQELLVKRRQINIDFGI